jgi:hypothetical protein
VRLSLNRRVPTRRYNILWKLRIVSVSIFQVQIRSGSSVDMSLELLTEAAVY